MKQIQIGGMLFEYQEVEKLRGDDDHRLNGHILYDERTIKVEATALNVLKLDIVWHEVIHGIAMLACADVDEKVVELLAYGITGVLRMNPQLGSEKAFEEWSKEVDDGA